ncbi:MAG: sulfatase-like hydrolase/transferase [Acidobacteria bacterium]|nr:sulfatase-like hydrolase/transferase [Acidobacteriota bacterium]
MTESWSRRRFLASTAALLTPPPARPPNVIVLYTDDQGIGDVGCYGSTDIKTPNIDSLAAAGARFTDFYSAAPVCSPSRAALLTGRYPLRCGVPNIVESAPGVVGLRGSEITLAEALKPRGYRTGLVGKWHVGSAPESLPNAQAFDGSFGFLSGCIDCYSHLCYSGGRGRDPFHDLWRNRTEVWENGRYMTELITEDQSAKAEPEAGRRAERRDSEMAGRGKDELRMKRWCVLFLALAWALFAQGKPNFSGTWELVLDRSDFGRIPPPKKSTDVITHREPKIKWKTTLLLPQGQFSEEFNYTTDGAENTNVSQGTTMRSHSRWDQGMLITEFDLYAKGPPTHFTERWRLADGGKTLINERVLVTKRGDVIQRLVYAKK